MPKLDKLAAYYKERGLRLLYLVFKEKGGGMVLVNPEKPELIPPEAPPVTRISITVRDEKATPSQD